MDEIANTLEMAPATLQGYMEQWTRPAKKRTIELAAEFFDVDIAELWGPELTSEELELRHARAMLRDSLGADRAAMQTDEHALKFYRLAKTVINASIAD